MKRLIFLAALAVFAFASCDWLFDDDESGERNGSSAGTRIVFDNRANPFPVSVYPNSARRPADRIASVAGAQRSREIDFIPSPGGFRFYLSYSVSVEGIDFSVNLANAHMLFSIPEDVTTPVPISPLSAFVSPTDALVSGAYLYIRNRGTSLLTIARGVNVIRDENGQENVNPGASALFGVGTGNASAYSVSSGMAIGVQLPSGLTFQNGHVYILEFDGSTVSLEREVPITLGNSAAIFRSGSDMPLGDLLAWVQANAQRGDSYVIEINSEYFRSDHLELPAGVALTLEGDGRIVRLSVLINSGATLVLNNIDLRSSLHPQINVFGTLIMNEGSSISGPTGSGTSVGGGVRVHGVGRVTMNSGSIFGRTDTAGGVGGVSIPPGGMFYMHGGTISGRATSMVGVNVGGVFNSGVFRISNGSIQRERGGAAFRNEGTVQLVDANGNFVGILNITNADINVVNGVLQ